MRTISETHRDRLVAEAEEAEVLGLVKIAENLTTQIEKQPVRRNNEGYTYEGSDFQNDIENVLWDAVVRTADFHGTHIDSEKAQKIVERYADLFVSDLRKAARLKDNGANERLLPGEYRIKSSEVISVEE